MPPEKLLSCPFQDENGDNHSIRIYHDKYGYAGECLDCGFALPVSSTEPLAIKRWNTRPSSPELVELRKDKERLDWLEANLHSIAISGRYANDHGISQHFKKGHELRTAIDAAKEKK